MVTKYWNCWFSASKAKKQSHECHREHSWSFDKDKINRGKKKHLKISFFNSLYVKYQGGRNMKINRDFGTLPYENRLG